MELRWWFGGGQATACCALLTLGTLGAWTQRIPWRVYIDYTPSLSLVEPTTGWTILLAAVGTTAAGALLAVTLAGPAPRGRLDDLWGALSVGSAVAFASMLCGYAALGYDLRPTLVGLLSKACFSPVAPFSQVFGSLASGIFLIDFARRRSFSARDPLKTVDRTAAALSGALGTLVAVCGVQPPYFMH